MPNAFRPEPKFPINSYQIVGVTVMTATPTNHLLEIKEIGQSIWMDNLTRDLIESGELKQMIESRGLRGITSNPAIFEKAIAGNVIYDADIEAGIRAGKSVMEIYESLVFEDIRNACDIFAPVYAESNGLDGYISIEVPPTIANDTESTISEAINVNVTLLFSVDSYVETFWAYIRGLEARVAKGLDVSNIASVASFFLSRIDINIDGKIDEKLKNVTDISTKAKLEAVKGKIAIANAKVAYQKYKEIVASDRWQALAAKGAKVQRLLWASTSTKNPNYSDVMYVDELIGPDTVNTLPPNTVEACFDHCDVAPRIENNVEEAYTLIESLKDPDIDINLDKVMADLLIDGIEKFVSPFQSLMDSLQEKVQKLSPVA